MCELSAAGGSCQDDEGFQCGGGQYPCLPHWKFGEDLTRVVGRGAAPDGDIDALTGMLLAVLALEGTDREPDWLEEVGQWAYDTCKQFYLSSTVPSPSGSHQIVKLGSCWGGWGTQGQNPSYHAPGIYRLCRDYMSKHDSRYGGSSTEGDRFETKWETLIATTYKMLSATQCPSTGLVPNWAQVFEEGRRLRAQTGFSGSGTPGAEYGAEASRTIWRVVVDFVLYPSEAGSAAQFLEPVATHLGKKESSGRWASSLDIDGACLVETIHPGWQVNMFMAAPTFASLVCPASGLGNSRQQELIDSAGRLLATQRIRDYYSGSWVAISTMTLNGDLAKAAANARLGAAQSSRSVDSFQKLTCFELMAWQDGEADFLSCKGTDLGLSGVPSDCGAVQSSAVQAKSPPSSESWDLLQGFVSFDTGIMWLDFGVVLRCMRMWATSGVALEGEELKPEDPMVMAGPSPKAGIALQGLKGLRFKGTNIYYPHPEGKKPWCFVGELNLGLVVPQAFAPTPVQPRPFMPQARPQFEANVESRHPDTEPQLSMVAPRALPRDIIIGCPQATVAGALMAGLLCGMISTLAMVVCTSWYLTRRANRELPTWFPDFVKYPFENFYAEDRQL
ncbi:idp1, partial [Symbiodinium pilosum]